MPKCTTDEIKLELSKLEGSGLVCAIAYLKAELARREGSSRNKGAKQQHDDPKHRSWREASKRYRAAKKKAEPAYQPFDET